MLGIGMDLVIPVLAIDGPSGAGKGTVSRTVAQELGWHYLDSGAIYRALAIAVLQQRVSLDNEVEIIPVAKNLQLEFRFDPQFSVYVDSEDVSDQIQSESCGDAASKIAAYSTVRDVLLNKQRDFRDYPGLVADGRDMGTVVFSDAPYKVFLTASAEIRAQRRYKQLKEKGMNVNLDQITYELEKRDQRDKNRKTAPLIQAADAVCIDSSEISVSQAVARVLEFVDSK